MRLQHACSPAALCGSEGKCAERVYAARTRLDAFRGAYAEVGVPIQVPTGRKVVSETLQVLLVEDNAGDARLLQEMFSKERAGSFELSHLTHMRDAEARLTKGGVDI